MLKKIKSVLAAMLGVQSSRNAAEDFNPENSPWTFITIGVIFVILFVLSVYSVVRWVVS